MHRYYDKDERTASITIVLFVALLVLAMCTSCGRLRLDNTASGGGFWSLDTYHPCYPVEDEAIGGNAGNVGNSTTRGGSTDAD